MKTRIKERGCIGSNVVNVEKIVTNDIDWEQRRFELVKAVAQSMAPVIEVPLIEQGTYYPETLAKKVIEFADSILAEYRKE